MTKKASVSVQGLESLLGEHVVLWCMNYIYSGRLTAVTANDALLEDAFVVYETGDLCAKAFANAQSLPGPHYVRTAAIESYGKRGF